MNNKGGRLKRTPFFVPGGQNVRTGRTGVDRASRTIGLHLSAEGPQRFKVYRKWKTSLFGARRALSDTSNIEYGVTSRASDLCPTRAPHPGPFTVFFFSPSHSLFFILLSFFYRETQWKHPSKGKPNTQWTQK